MDYKYIEQLLQRYWDCETTQAEEQVLRAFFAQDDVPAHLAAYGSLFRAFADEREAGLDSRFDERMLSLIGETTVQARRNSLRLRLRPFYHAAAVVAIVFTLGMAAQHSFRQSPAEADIPVQSRSNYTIYPAAPADPQVAYEQQADSAATAPALQQNP